MQLETPFGPAWAKIDDAGRITAFGFGQSPDKSHQDHPELRRQLTEYFTGARTSFDLPLAAKGSAFQSGVWAELCKIPFGATISYAELARRAGCAGAPRAVGRANATNPIALIVPCHRVIGSNGKLTGYAGGLELKAKLINWERAHRQASLADAGSPQAAL